MPVYNAEKFLRIAIDSILNQTFKDFEFIILNDGSTDSSLEIIRSYHDCRIKLIHNEVNMGYCAKLNEGLEAASGKYIARMDSDDISLTQRLEKQVDFLETNIQYGLCCCNASVINENGLAINERMFFRDNTPLEWQLLWTNSIAHPSVMFRKKVIEDNNFKYDRELYPAEDYDLWCRMRAVTKFYRFDDVLIKYRISSNSAFHSNLKKAIDKSIQISEIYLRTFTGNTNIPWYHFEIVRFSFSGKANFDNFNIKQIKVWTSELSEILNKKYNWTKAELKLVRVNNYQRYISLIKRTELPFHQKMVLFLKHIPLDVLFSTFLIRAGIRK